MTGSALQSLDVVWFVVFSERKLKGERESEGERVCNRTGWEAGGFQNEVFLALFFNAVFSMRLQALFGFIFFYFLC